MTAQERVVRHGMLDYIDPDGVRRVALRGEKVRIDGDALKRAEEFEALEPVDADEPADTPTGETSDGLEGPASSPPGAQEPALPPLAPQDVVGGEPAAAEQPPKAANKAAWVDYAVSEGADRDEAESMTKDQLIGKYGA